MTQLSAWRIAGRVAYLIFILLCAVVIGLWMLNEDMLAAFRGLANKLLTFNAACIGVFVMEQLYSWFHKFRTNRGLDHVEENPMGSAIYLGLRTIGLCWLAASIFGSV